MDSDVVSQASAIDDSFFPVPLVESTEPTPEDASGLQSQFRGRRSGHWTVSSTTSGSGIDDRTPANFNAPVSLGSSVPDRTRRVNGDLLRRLAAATERERKSKIEEAKQDSNSSVADAKIDHGTATKPREEQGFYMPRLDDSRGIRIRSRNGKEEVVKQAMPKRSARSEISEQNTGMEKAATDLPRSQSPPASLRSVSATSHSSQRTTNLVRILAKNGEECFVELPFLPQVSKSVSTAHTRARRESFDDDRAKKLHNALAEKEAKKLRKERIEADLEAEYAEYARAKRDTLAQKEASRLRQERMATEVTMHGAIPMSSNASSAVPSPKRSKGSSKASTPQPGGMSGVPFKAQSIASSKTSMSEAKSGSQLESQHESGNAPQEQPGSQSTAGWQEVGIRMYAPAVSSRSQPEVTIQQLQPPKTRTQKSRPESRQPQQQQYVYNARTTSQKWSPPRPTSAQRSNRDPSAPPTRTSSENKANQRPAQDGSAFAIARSQATSSSADSFPVAFPPLGHYISPHKTYHSGAAGLDSTTHRSDSASIDSFPVALPPLGYHLSPRKSYRSGVAGQSDSASIDSFPVVFPPLGHYLSPQNSSSIDSFPVAFPPLGHYLSPQSSYHSGAAGFDSTTHQSDSASLDSFPVAFPPLSSNPFQQRSSQSEVHVDPDQPQGPTVFAGRGWISPHPLSEAPTWAREEPDPLIQLPSGALMRTDSGAETMTYEEWLAVQNQPRSSVGSRKTQSNVHTVISSTQNRMEEVGEGTWTAAGRRNISRTSSHASAYAQGTWGFQADTQRSRSNYRVPTVKTESPASGVQEIVVNESRISGKVGDRVEIQDEGGNSKTWVKMPWDVEKGGKYDEKGGKDDDDDLWF